MSITEKLEIGIVVSGFGACLIVVIGMFFLA